jgi:hypothetical protein
MVFSFALIAKLLAARNRGRARADAGAGGTRNTSQDQFSN